MVDDEAPRSFLDVLGQAVEVAGGIVLALYMLDQWTDGTVRDVLRSFVEGAAATVKAGPRLPSAQEVSAVHRSAETITKEAADERGMA